MNHSAMPRRIPRAKALETTPAMLRTVLRESGFHAGEPLILVRNTLPPLFNPDFGPRSRFRCWRRLTHVRVVSADASRAARRQLLGLERLDVI